MATAQPATEDPVLAALPPATDYLTYLTLLEYNLTPEKLPTLNKALTDDDGTLAQEIGWDLLRLVLPMLEQNAPEATKCLDCIARRGNPREVIVKVAEVLERLGDEEDGSVASEGQEEHMQGEELSTFEGEADRIHLGEMTLHGMPPRPQARSPEAAGLAATPGESRSVGAKSSGPTIQLQSLFAMLSILHLRINTQYPSRFLATSLPAALGAYRRIGITPDSTYAFLSLLSRLSGKQPELPPRPSMMTQLPNTSQAPQAQVPAAIRDSLVSLPDSEANVESISVHQVSKNEKAVILRLLRAVLLETLDDYMISLQSQEPPHMSWATRLQEQNNPQRTVPGKLTELQKWRDDDALRERDSVLDKFLELSRDLKLNIPEQLIQVLDDTRRGLSSHDHEDEPLSEYPAKPSDVPIPLAGVVFLLAAHRFSAVISPSFHPEHVHQHHDSLPTLAQAYNLLRSADNPSYLQNPFATEDALLCLLFLAKDTACADNEDFDFRGFLLSIATFCAEFPDPQMRDAAYHIVTALFHACLRSVTKIGIVKEILQNDSSQPSLKAVAISWTKDEIVMSVSGDNNNKPEGRIQLSDVKADEDITTLLFPVLTTVASPNSTQDAILSDLLQLPYYIASLNLIYIIRSNHRLSQSCEVYSPSMNKTLSDLEEYRSRLLSIAESDPTEPAQIEVKELLQASATDLWALDDAVRRVEALAQ